MRLDNENDIHPASGAQFDFWLFRGGERSQDDYHGLLSREDAPVSLPEDVMGYLYDALQWVPTMSGLGIKGYDPVVLQQAGGAIFQNICAGTAQVLAQGPESLVLSYGWTQYADDEGNITNGHPYRFRIARDYLVRALEKLADFGGLVATGDYFLFLLVPE